MAVEAYNFHFSCNIMQYIACVVGIVCISVMNITTIIFIFIFMLYPGVT